MPDASRPASERSDAKRGPNRRARVVGVMVLATVAGVVAGYLLTRAPGPPGTPTEVSAKPARCATPCRRPQAAITVRWVAPEDGGRPSGYTLVRDDVPIATVGPKETATGTTSYTDHGVTFGQRYAYRVVALSSQGSSPPSSMTTVTLSTPPIGAAQLRGEYAVELSVKHALAVSSMLGIEAPKPGRTFADRWTFEASCPAPDVACSARWEGLDGTLVSDGRSWSGTVAGPPARCGGGTTVEAPTRFDLTSTAAEGEADEWIVRRFEGSVTVSFHCPGFLTSTGAVEVTGTRR